MTALRRTRRSRLERAAALPEYALIVAVFAVGTLGGIEVLKDSASAAFHAQAEDLSAGPSAGSSSSTSSTVAPSSTAPAPTTAAPTTAPPTTPTTTAAPRTTTTSTTTTVARATTAGAAWSSPSSTRSGSSWTAAATLTVTDERGQPVRNAEVTVLIEYRDADGRWRQADEVDGTTSSTGAVRVSSGDLARSGRDAVTSIRYTVVDVDADGLQWTGTASSVTLSAP